jgi:hypothetical protein
MSKIRVLVDDAQQTEASSRAARPSIEDLLRSAAGKTVEMEVEALAEQVAAAYAKVLSTLSSLPTAEAFHLQSVGFTLSIDSTGGVSLASAMSGAVKTQAGLTFVITKSGTAVADATVGKA